MGGGRRWDRCRRAWRKTRLSAWTGLSPSGWLLHDNRFYGHLLSTGRVNLWIDVHTIPIGLRSLPEILGTSHLYLLCRGGHTDDSGKSYCGKSYHDGAYYLVFFFPPHGKGSRLDRDRTKDLVFIFC